MLLFVRRLSGKRVKGSYGGKKLTGLYKDRVEFRKWLKKLAFLKVAKEEMIPLKRIATVGVRVFITLCDGSCSDLYRYNN